MIAKAVFNTRLWKCLHYCLLGAALVAAGDHSHAAPGGLDPDFKAASLDSAPFLDSRVRAIALQGDGKILICGNFRTVQGLSRMGIARLDTDGRIDLSFLAGLSETDGAPDAVAVQPDGKILIGGGFTKFNGISRARIARLNADGSVDTSFLSNMSGPSSTIHSLALLPDGKIFIGGDFYSVNGVVRTNIARLNSDGSLDPSFGDVPPASSLINLPNYYSYLGQMALQKDGKVIAWRSVTTYSGDWHGNDYQLARFNSDASLDVAFPYFSHAGWYANPGVSAIAIQGDGKILVGGDFDWPRTNLARLNPSGDLDYSFSPAIVGAITAIVSQGDGKIIICGFFTTVNGSPHNYIARLNIDGSVDPSFAAGLDGGFAYSLALQRDNKVLIGGDFTLVNGTPCSGLARLMTSDIPPAILRSPQTQTCEEGTSVRFAVDAVGYPPPACQWYFKNGPLNGRTSPTLELTNALPSESGTYVVVLTNVAGAITSTPAVLNVIPPVDRKPVLALQVIAEIGSLLNLEYSDGPIGSATWLPLDTVVHTAPSEFWFDVAGPIRPQRFYRAWQSEMPGIVPSLKLNSVPAITLAGDIGKSLRLDGINAIGPTNAWETLATVMLTNTFQLFFDVSSIGQPRRLYRIVPVP